MNILAIESSCDESAAAVMTNGQLRSNVIAAQLIHQKYGGVVPELASRAHQQHIVGVVEEALAVAEISKNQLDAIAFTRGPGLLGSLLVGASFAKAMALALGLPLVEVHHLQAHVLAHFIDEPHPKFPFLCLTVSGGHTQIVLVKDHLDMTIIGETQDDAVGEAFDKTAKLLGLPYPGGPLIDRYAKQGDPHKFKFPIPNVPELNYSFSGIKTAILYFLQKEKTKNPVFVEENLTDICASVQHTLVEILLVKLKEAITQTGITEIAIAGGVSANSGLRAALETLSEVHGWVLHLPKFEYCTDNAAMIAAVAHQKAIRGLFSPQSVSPMPRFHW